MQDIFEVGPRTIV